MVMTALNEERKVRHDTRDVNPVFGSHLAYQNKEKCPNHVYEDLRSLTDSNEVLECNGDGGAWIKKNKVTRHIRLQVIHASTSKAGKPVKASSER